MVNSVKKTKRRSKQRGKKGYNETYWLQNLPKEEGKLMNEMILNNKRGDKVLNLGDV